MIDCANKSNKHTWDIPTIDLPRVKRWTKQQLLFLVQFVTKTSECKEETEFVISAWSARFLIYFIGLWRKPNLHLVYLPAQQTRQWRCKTYREDLEKQILFVFACDTRTFAEISVWQESIVEISFKGWASVSQYTRENRIHLRISPRRLTRLLAVLPRLWNKDLAKYTSLSLSF